MMPRIAVFVSAAVIVSAFFGGCVGSNNGNAGDLPDESEANQSAGADIYGFDLSKYNATLPSGENIYADVEYLSNTYPIRYLGTQMHDDCAQYLLDRFNALGLDSSFQNFEASGYGCKNVLGFKWGENRSDWIVFGAHYDSTPYAPFITFQGAYDNIGGCAAVLEAARVISKYNSTKTFVFALWDDEEDGLWGSAYFVKAFKKNATFVNFNYDCYGFNYPCKTMGALPLLHYVGINTDKGGASSNSTGGISFNDVLTYAADNITGIPKDLQEFFSPASNSDHASFGKYPYAYFLSDPTSLEVLCYPNMPQDTLATWILAAGGAEEMKKGLEFPVLYSYYSAILWSECGVSAQIAEEPEPAEQGTQ